MNERITLLPVGCVEEHSHLPRETDTLIALAFCELVRTRMYATVEEPIERGFCPTTSAFEATQVLRFEDVFHEVSERVRRLVDAGRRYIVMVNIHASNDEVLKAIVGDVYIERGLPLFYFNPFRAFAGELDATCFFEKDNSYKECSLLLAGLEILGRPTMAGPSVDDARGRDQLVEELRRFGAVGFSYKLPHQHVGWRADASAQAGREYLEETADRFVPVAGMFKEYVGRELGCREAAGRS
jgi:creatinine amidohydrolase/Fe(II)-dependent formamide hydrolase-like protein